MQVIQYWNHCQLPGRTNLPPEHPHGPIGRHVPHEQMTGNLFLPLLIFVVSVISGMLGIGVAFAAVPILGIHSQDLVHEVQPISIAPALSDGRGQAVTAPHFR